MIILLIIIIVIIITMHQYTGGIEYLYHGSHSQFKTLKPFPIGVINGESAVFATPNYNSAVVFSAQWTDWNFGFGSVNGSQYLCEQYPGALSKLNKTGFIHYVNAKSFHNDKRLPKSELISYNSVKVLKCEKINVMKIIMKSNIRIIYFEDLFNDLQRNPKLETGIRVNILYVPIDIHWDPKIDNTIVLRSLDDYKFSDENVNIVVDIISEFDGCYYDIIYNKAYLVEPKIIKFPYTKSKTTPEEYQLYIESRRKLYSHFERLIV